MSSPNHKTLLLIDETSVNTEKSVSAMTVETPKRSYLMRFALLGALAAVALGGCAELGGISAKIERDSERNLQDAGYYGNGNEGGNGGGGGGGAH